MKILKSIILAPFWPFIQLYKILFPIYVIQWFATYEDLQRNTLDLVYEILVTYKTAPRIANVLIDKVMRKFKRDERAFSLGYKDYDDDRIIGKPKEENPPKPLPPPDPAAVTPESKEIAVVPEPQPPQKPERIVITAEVIKKDKNSK